MSGSEQVIVLAGRRIDAPGAAHPRFPLECIDTVTRELHECFASVAPAALVCSAANGADLIALQVARELRIRFRIVLPCAIHEFRINSVMDRPGAIWHTVFDALIASAQEREDLIIVDATGSTTDYLAVNDRIIAEGAALDRPILGVAVWDGRSRGADDVTAAFVDLLAEKHIPVRHIATLPQRRHSTKEQTHGKGAQ